jgi:hypothetical protein
LLKKGIYITVLSYNDDDAEFGIKISNGQASGYLEIYEYYENLLAFAEQLLNFPESMYDDVQYTVGNEDSSWAYFLNLKACSLDSDGFDALYVNLDNHQTAPGSLKTEFFINTPPGSLNQLGELLKNWNPKEEEELIWEAE